jgi:hypothetical protein
VLRKITMKDETPLEASMEFFYDADTDFLPLPGSRRHLLNGAALPLTPKQKVAIQWVPHPTNPSHKIAVLITERR